MLKIVVFFWFKLFKAADNHSTVLLLQLGQQNGIKQGSLLIKVTWLELHLLLKFSINVWLRHLEFVNEPVDEQCLNRQEVYFIIACQDVTILLCIFGKPLHAQFN